MDAKVRNVAADKAPAWVRGIAPYVPGKPIEELARELGLDPATIVKLASNENPRGPSPKAIGAIADAAADLTRYPDGNGFALRAALALRHGVAPERIVLGNGSNDILELVSQAFLTPGDEAVYAQHAFAVYPLADARARREGHRGAGARLRPRPRRDGRRDHAAHARRVRREPEQPDRHLDRAVEGRAFLDAVPRDVVVVLDEAYDEYLDEADQSPAISWVVRHPNLVVSRTFSKAYGLAALRVGYGVMEPSVADMLNRVRQPFNVNALAQAAAIAALGDAGYVAESARLNREGLRRLEEGLAALGVATLPSHGNFILARVGDAARIYGDLLRQGVIVRPVAGYGLPEWLRITVGLPAENERFLAALGKSLGR
jgi:histidinol-phosphate aminotransferase